MMFLFDNAPNVNFSFLSKTLSRYQCSHSELDLFQFIYIPELNNFNRRANVLNICDKSKSVNEKSFLTTAIADKKFPTKCLCVLIHKLL